MKKMFIAALTAMAMCSYSYAQDDEEEYEEDEAPAVEQSSAAEEEEEEEEAPVAKKEKTKKSSGSKLSFGLGMGLTSGNLAELDFKIKLNPSMEATAILGFKNHGATSTESGGVTIKGSDGSTSLKIGAGFDYYINMPLLPISAGAELAYFTNGETVVDASTTNENSGVYFDLMFGVHAPIAPNFTISGKAGLGIGYNMTEVNITNAMGVTVTAESSRMDVGIKAGLYATWYFM
ncbi:MAG: hypothetical protein MJZ05_13160 [Fibrobacter sp.]|nr:hypothetical protein [Fibrobacter sp.]